MFFFLILIIVLIIFAFVIYYYNKGTEYEEKLRICNFHDGKEIKSNVETKINCSDINISMKLFLTDSREYKFSIKSYNIIKDLKTKCIVQDGNKTFVYDLKVKNKKKETILKITQCGKKKYLKNCIVLINLCIPFEEYDCEEKECEEEIPEEIPEEEEECEDDFYADETDSNYESDFDESIIISRPKGMKQLKEYLTKSSSSIIRDSGSTKQTESTMDCHTSTETSDSCHTSTEFATTSSESDKSGTSDKEDCYTSDKEDCDTSDKNIYNFSSYLKI